MQYRNAKIQSCKRELAPFAKWQSVHFNLKGMFQMKTLKIYTTLKPAKLAGHYPMTCEVYSINSQGAKISETWFSEINTDDYFNTRLDLEKLGFAAHPANSREIESKEYTIFREAAR